MTRLKWTCTVVRDGGLGMTIRIAILATRDLAIVDD